MAITIDFPSGGSGAGLDSNTFTGAQIISVNGAASTPPLKLTGTVFTGGTATTTKPQLLIEPSGTTSTGWSTGGAGIGVNLPAFAAFTNSASIVSTPMAVDCQENGSRLMAVTKMTFGGNPNAPTLLGGGSYPVSLSLVGSNGLAYFRRIDDGWLMCTGSGFLTVPSGARIGFSDQATGANIPTGTGAVDAFFVRSAAAHIKMGATNATTATNQTFSAHNVTTGTGADLTLAGGTGTSTPGSQIILGGGIGGAGNSAITAKVSSGGALTTIFTVAEDGITIGDNLAINAGTTSGLTIAGSTSQKLGFWGAGPVVQGAAITDVPFAPSVTGSDTVSQTNLESVLASYGVAINDILIRLRTPGFIAT